MYSGSYAVREQTLLTPIRVAQKTTFLEWGTQPSIFKHYPDFSYRLRISDHPELQWISSIRKISDKHLIAGKPYYRLNVPSAGNLHPIEMYVQIRNVKGVLGGVYHLDPLTDELVLIQEVERDGLEREVGMDVRFNGFLLFFSIVPFRSSWKYGLRGWRYCYLDLGHQLGNLFSVLNHFGFSATKLSLKNTDSLNRVMGMGEDEFVAAGYAIGEVSTKPALRFESDLMHVQPTSYTKRDPFLYQTIAEELLYSHIPLSGYVPWSETLNDSRRSAREFYPERMKDDALRAIVATTGSETLEIVHVVIQAQSMHCGIYQSGLCTDRGQFGSEIVHLLLEQRFIAQASVVSLIFAKRFDAQSHIEAGMYAQHLYMLCEDFGIGCTGVGAFYDDEASRWSELPLIYAAAIGG